MVMDTVWNNETKQKQYPGGSDAPPEYGARKDRYK